MFHFKQFAVDQANCAMKINTDGVLLGAMANNDAPQTILDIGTGTGVIALMLTQRFLNAKIDAVEIDLSAAETAKANFVNSPFNIRLTIFPESFQSFSASHPEKKYNLIVSNPPFFLNSLESPKAKVNLAKHTDEKFFEELITVFQKHLLNTGLAWVVLPVQAATLVKGLTRQKELHLHKVIKIHSFLENEPHREILALGLNAGELVEEKFVIYNKPNNYSAAYLKLLKDYFLHF